MSDDLNYIFSQQGIQELKERLGIMPEENTNESADPDAEYLSDEISVSVIEDIKQRQTTNRLIGSFGMKMKAAKGLTFDYLMGIDNYAQNGTTYIPPYAYNVNPAFFGGGVTLDPTLNGYASTASNHFFQINHDYTVSSGRNPNAIIFIFNYSV